MKQNMKETHAFSIAAGDLKNIFVGEKLFSLSYSSAVLKVRQTTFKSHVYCVLTEVSVFFFLAHVHLMF